MALSYSAKQRFICLGIFIVTIIVTHFAFQALNPEWLLYRQPEELYHQKKWEQAIALYEESFAKGLHNFNAMARLAEVYAKNKNYPKAIEWYVKCLQIKPHNLWARKALAGSYEANGEFDKAAEQLQIMLKEEATPRTDSYY